MRWAHDKSPQRPTSSGSNGHSDRALARKTGRAQTDGRTNRNWRGSTPEPDSFSPLWSPTPGPAHHLSPGYWLLPPPLSSTISLAARGTLPNPQSPSVAPLQSLQHGACRLATPQAVPEVASLPPPLLLAPQCFLTTLTGLPRLAGNSRSTSLTHIEETL